MGTISGNLLHTLYRIVVIASRLRALFSQSKKLHTARFARVHELQSLLTTTVATDTSLLLGSNRLKHVLQVRPLKTRRELGNVLIVAPTRGGKGLLATSQLLTWNHSVVVNDIKGELFHQTAGYRSSLGPVYVIDPTGIGHRYDPLTGKQTEDELLSAATQLLYKPDEGDGAIFTQRATVMLTQILLAARMEHAAPLPSVRQCIRSGLTETAAWLNAISPELATQFLDVSYTQANMTDRFLLSAWGTLSARMRPLLTETVIRCFTGTDFTAQELMCSAQPVTVYLRWTERDLLALAPLVRLLWGSFIDELITTYDATQGRNCKPVLLLIDEAGRTAIPSLSDHATTVCGRGISLWVAIQSLSQLDAVYGKAHAHILRDNMESQVYYRPTDQDTADYLEHRLGRTSAFAHSETKREGIETSEGQSEQGIPLMTAQEILQLKDEDILGFHRRLPPFKALRMDWRQYPLLIHRKNMPAPHLSPLPELDELPRTVQSTEQLSYGYFDPDM